MTCTICAGPMPAVRLTEHAPDELAEFERWGNRLALELAQPPDTPCAGCLELALKVARHFERVLPERSHIVVPFPSSEQTPSLLAFYWLVRVSGASLAADKPRRRKARRS